MEILTLPVTEVLLLTIFFLGFLVEIKTGGFGAGILLGLVAAGVFFGSHYIQGLVSIYQIGIFLLGILFIAAEILMPTVGLLAVLGIGAMLYSVALALGSDLNALYAMVIAFVLAIIIFAVILKRLPSSRLWDKVILRKKSAAEEGYVSAIERKSLLGIRGIVLTDLRPAGSALLDGEPVDVVSEGSFIGKGESVIVVSVNGSRVVVRKM